MLDVILAFVGLLAVVIAALSERIRSLPLSAPLLALATGVVLGPEVTGLLDVASVVDRHAEFHDGTRILLAVSVMAVALRYPFADVRDQGPAAALLVAVAMAGMAALTAGVAALALGVSAGVALLLGAALCPTDPVLASSTVTGRSAEETLPARTRQLLSIESGANDGLALPLVLVAVAVAGAETVGDNSLEAVWQVVGATLVGVGAGWAGGRALRAGEEHGSTEPGPALLFTLVLALAVLGACGLLRVDGVLGVFVAGMAFNAVTTGTERGSAVPVDEAVNRFLVLPLFVLLGAALPWREWAELGWRGPALVLGVLLLRRLPVLLALRRPLRLSRADALYLGWFGPIGVSALFYLTLAAERLAVDPAVLAAGTLVVAASTLVHGVTGTLGLRLYRRSAVDTVSDTGRQPVAGRQTG
jgi:NhaP-type Na+/H+ or K+/H+ antiporter